MKERQIAIDKAQKEMDEEESLLMKLERELDLEEA